jgi:hypothetical protein
MTFEFVTPYQIFKLHLLALGKRTVRMKDYLLRQSHLAKLL